MARPFQDELAGQFAYDEVANTYADHFRSTEPELPVDLAMVEHFCSLLRGGGYVLDAGCGAGRMMPLLAGLGCQVEGVDLSPEMIRRARQDHPSFRSQVASLRTLPFPEKSFEGVFSWYSTIHSSDADLPHIVAETRRVLQTGGLYLVAFQTGQSVRDISAAFRRSGHDVVLHRYDRPAEDLTRLIASAEMTEVARFERGASPQESTGQAIIIARA